MNPTVTASTAVLDELYDHLTSFVRELDTDTINWRPAADQTNSIAAMVSHLVGSTDRWLAAAAGSAPTGSREAELRVRSTADQLVELIERGRADAHRWFASMDSSDPGTMRSEWRSGQPAGAGFSQAWGVEHALIHAGEHWGQIQLTRQLKPTT